MKKLALIVLLSLLFIMPTAKGQQDSTYNHSRQYSLVYGPHYELETFATTGITLNKVFTDIYYRGFANEIPQKLAPWTDTIWSIFWSFMCTMWPHDGGHWSRAQQVGGDFVITKFGFPFPVAEMRLPDVLDPKDETLISIGGHEINFLMREQIHSDYYDKQYIYADELIHAFVQDVLFPFYAFVIASADPTEPSIWLDTRGDPVEYTLSVYKSYTGRPPVRDDGTVDPTLIKQYRESSYLSVIWPLLNPLFYKSLTAFSADMRQNHGLMLGPWMLRGNNVSWSWGTHFHPSPLGYELHLNNYILYNEKLLIVKLKSGRPYKNIGVGISSPRILEKGAFQFGLSADIWDQDKYGNGISMQINAAYRPENGLGLIVKSGYKSEGYLVGRNVDESWILLAGITYDF